MPFALVGRVVKRGPRGAVEVRAGKAAQVEVAGERAFVGDGEAGPVDVGVHLGRAGEVALGQGVVAVADLGPGRADSASRYVDGGLRGIDGAGQGEERHAGGDGRGGVRGEGAKRVGGAGQLRLAAAGDPGAYPKDAARRRRPATQADVRRAHGQGRNQRGRGPAHLRDDPCNYRRGDAQAGAEEGRGGYRRGSGDVGDIGREGRVDVVDKAVCQGKETHARPGQGQGRGHRGSSGAHQGEGPGALLALALLKEHVGGAQAHDRDRAAHEGAGKRGCVHARRGKKDKCPGQEHGRQGRGKDRRRAGRAFF